MGVIRRERRRAYHWQIGRETTAGSPHSTMEELAYHWQIGRETTASATVCLM